MERVVPSWSTHDHETEAGAVESRQWITLPRELVAPDEGGALELGRRYLAEVGRFSRGLVRPHRQADGLDLVLARVVPLLRFGPPQPGHENGVVECRYPIRGGLLVGRPGGWLVVAQHPGVELELVVAGYVPRLGGGARPRSLRRALYTRLQARAHHAVGRMFLEGAVREVNA